MAALTRASAWAEEPLKAYTLVYERREGKAEAENGCYGEPIANGVASKDAGFHKAQRDRRDDSRTTRPSNAGLPILGNKGRAVFHAA